jgi:prepilin-type N-terminal cleavage/methylation domain-containing protein
VKEVLDMKKLLRKFRYGEKGFTLIELLVVVAILGVLAAVAVPNVGKFIGRGKNEAKETELHNIQTGVMAMLADAATGQLLSMGTPINIHHAGDVIDMHSVTANNTVGTTLYLDSYITGLGDSPATANVTETAAPKTGCSYEFASDGTVKQYGP